MDNLWTRVVTKTPWGISMGNMPYGTKRGKRMVRGGYLKGDSRGKALLISKMDNAH